MKKLSGETGAKPVRARRRKARFVIYLTQSRNLGKRHWKIPRRLENDAPSRNIRKQNLSSAAEPAQERES